MMDDQTKSPQSELIEFKGNAVLRIPLVANPSPETPWHWLAFGKNKAKAMVKYFEAIKKSTEAAGLGDVQKEV